MKFSEDPPERLEYTLDPSFLSLLEHSGLSSQQLDSGSAINKGKVYQKRVVCAIYVYIYIQLFTKIMAVT